MVRSMYSGVASLRTHQQKMDVIGNNIANINTFGFKNSRAAFKDNLYQMLNPSTNPTLTMGGRNAKQVGYGAQVASIDTAFTVGGYVPTGLPLDTMINGDGFFLVGERYAEGINAKTGEVTILNLTRIGNFNFDSNGFLVDSNGYHVYGFMDFLKQDMTIRNPAYSNVQKERADFIMTVYNVQQFEAHPDYVAREATEHARLASLYNVPRFLDFSAAQDGSDIRVNNAANNADYIALIAGGTHFTATPLVDDTVEVFDQAAYQASMDISYNETIRLQRYLASPGDPTTGTLNNAGTNQYNMTLADNVANAKASPYPYPPATPNALYNAVDYNAALNFETNASLMGTNLKIQRFIPDPNNLPNGMPNPDFDERLFNEVMNRTPYTVPERIEVTIDVADTGYIYPIQLPRDNNGVPLDIEGINIDFDGIITGIYRGEVVTIGQIAVANVPNSSALESLNSSYYKARNNTGIITAEVPGENATGMLSSGGLELSNVDLSKEFTEMITTQRGFQACARIITVSDEMLNELVNLKR